jgi:hypothetical protein
LGKHYSTVAQPNTNANAEPNANGFSIGIACLARGFTDFDICIPDCDSDTFAALNVEALVPSAYPAQQVLGTSTSTFTENEQGLHS